jgi:hypothetical protein
LEKRDISRRKITARDISRMTTSIEDYYTWNVTAPAVLSAILWLVVLVLLLILLPCTKGIPHILVEILQLGLSDILDDGGKIDNSKVNILAVKLLAGVIIPLTVATIFFSFWNVWLVEEEVTGACLPNFDCYPMLDGHLLQHLPVDNCTQFADGSMFMQLQNTTAAVLNETQIADMARQIQYECYRFVFNYAEGIGAAGGVLFFTAVFSKLYFSILVAIITTEGRRYLRLGLLVSVWVFAAVVWILFVVVNSATPVIRAAVFHTDTDTIQFFLYAVNFAAVVVGGYVVSIGIIAAA